MNEKSIQYLRWCSIPCTGYLSWVLVAWALEWSGADLIANSLFLIICVPVFFVSLVVATTAPKFKFQVVCVAIYAALAFPISELMADVNTRNWQYTDLWLKNLGAVVVVPAIVAGILGYVLYKILVACSRR